MSEELSIGSYLCVSHQFSSNEDNIVIFRNSQPSFGGDARFRMPNKMAEKFEDGKMYELFVRLDEVAKVPKRLLRKKKG